MEKDWVVVYSTPLEYKVDIIKAVLAENEIQSVVINKQDSMYKTTFGGTIELFVNRDDALKALQIINNQKL
ncbi:MAG: DUF2007 domain-containing protein [Bacteroidales bacterium]|nr:DUF2007 domain-containing protein [Bacteroidales bacterium]